MTDFATLVQRRRSHRVFQPAEVSADDVRLILRAGLMSPTSKSARAWHFVVVDDADKLQKLADAKDAGAQFIGKAAFAVAVCANPLLCDCWIEDCSCAAMCMQLQAEDLNLGSCWAQIRGRHLSDGTSSEEVVRGILNLPANMEVLCLLGFGKKGQDRPMQNEDRLKWENVHVNSFSEAE